eukprot:CAMPEP_0175375662 /NCGR_PEP_ID=MMETSP0095-20121207/23878_1 /TAXON_ID=311494 /ORGANISM="Alexandrium monilatum, Strain CCMP3105" /LENGTH=32 /DNA_ID= /DNA_START= /DNA_END= /DNA_ORIENTATION=
MDRGWHGPKRVQLTGQQLAIVPEAVADVVGAA